MTRRRGLLLAASLIGGVVALGLAISSQVSQDVSKERVSAWAESAWGRPVSIDGPLSLSLWPRPHLSAQGVRLANPPGASQPDLARIPSLDLRLGLLPLLTGRLDVTALRLHAPVVTLERLPDGRGNWQIQPWTSSAVVPAPPPESPPLPSAATASGPVAPRLPVLDITIEQGTLILRSADAPPLTMSALDGALSTRGDQGPFQLQAAARLDGLPLSLNGTLSERNGSRPQSLSASLELPGTGAGIRLTGQIDSGHQGFNGKVSAHLDDLARLAHLAGWATTLPAIPIKLDSPLTVSATDITADELITTLGKAQGSGRVTLHLGERPQAEVKLAFTRLDLDTPPAAPPAVGRAVAENSLPPAPPAAPPEAGGFVLPHHLGLSLDLSSEAIIWHGGLLRGAHVNAELADGEVVLNQASLSLPGDCDINLFGYLTAADGQPLFDGSVETGTDNLRGLLDWLHINTAGIPAGRLQSARLSGKLHGDGHQWRLDAPQAKLDDLRLNAAADLRLDHRPALGLTLATDSLDLDPYWPVPAGKPAEATAPAATPATAATPASTAPIPWLDGMDVTLQGQIGRLSGHGLTAQDLRLDAGWEENGLILRQLAIADLAGTRLALSGGLTGLAGPTPRLQGLHWEIHSKQPARLLRSFGLTPPAALEPWGGVTLTGSAEGGADSLHFDSQNDSGGLSLHLGGTLSGGLASPQFDLTAEASHASFPQFLRLLGADYQPAGTLGAFAAAGRLSGTPQALRLDDLRLKLGPLDGTGQGRLALPGESGRPHLDLTLSTGAFTIDPFLPAHRKAELPPAKEPPTRLGRFFPREDSPFRRNILTVSTGEPPPVAAAPLPPVAAGAIPAGASEQPLPLHWLTALDGSLKLDSAAVTWGHTRLDQASLAFSLGGGTASLERLVARLWNGSLSGSGKMTSGGQGSLTLGLSHAQAHDALLELADLSVAEGVLEAEANLTSQGQSAAELLGHLSGGGKMAVTNGQLKGFDLLAVDQKLQALNGPAGLIALFQAGLNGGVTRFSRLGGSFHASNGIIATDDLTLTAEGGEAKATASASLPANAIDARADIHLAGVSDAPPLVIRLNGPLDRPRRFLDINEIQTWLVRRGLGGKDADKTDGATPPAGQKIKPKDILKGFLRGL